MKRNCNYQEAPRSRLIYEFYFCHRYLQSRSYNHKITADRIVGALRTKVFVCTTLLSGEVTVQEKKEQCSTQEANVARGITGQGLTGW